MIQTFERRLLFHFARRWRSIREWQGVSEAAFYQWRRKLGGNLKPRQQSPVPRPAFAPVRLVTSSRTAEPVVTVQLPGGTRLEIPLSDFAALERAIRVLAQADAQCREGTPC